MRNLRTHVGVVGSKEVDSEEICKAAPRVGREIVRNGEVLVCIGLSGVMEPSVKGAKEAGGMTVGIIPGMTKNEANPHFDIVMVTGIGYARNTIIATTSDALVVVAGGSGTMSEVAFALNPGKPIAATKNTGGVAELRADKENDGSIVMSATSAEEAVRLVFEKIKNH